MINFRKKFSIWSTSETLNHQRWHNLLVLFAFLPVVMVFISCHSQSGQVTMDSQKLVLSVSNPSVATGFRIEEGQDKKILSIFHPWDSLAAPQIFYLVPDTSNALLPADVQAIHIPVKRIVCLSASHLSFLDALG